MDDAHDTSLPNERRGCLAVHPACWLPLLLPVLIRVCRCGRVGCVVRARMMMRHAPTSPRVMNDSASETTHITQALWKQQITLPFAPCTQASYVACSACKGWLFQHSIGAVGGSPVLATSKNDQVTWAVDRGRCRAFANLLPTSTIPVHIS